MTIITEDNLSGVLKEGFANNYPVVLIIQNFPLCAPG